MGLPVSIDVMAGGSHFFCPQASESLILPWPVDPAAPPRLLVPSSPPWPISHQLRSGPLVSLVPPWSVFDISPPRDSTSPAAPRPSGSVRPILPSESTLVLSCSSSTANLPDSCLRLSRQSHQLRRGLPDPQRYPCLVGYPSPPRAPPPHLLRLPSVGNPECQPFLHHGSSFRELYHEPPSWLWSGSHLAPPAPSPSCLFPGSSLHLIHPGSFCHRPGSSLYLICLGSPCFFHGSSLRRLILGLCSSSSSQVSVLLLNLHPYYLPAFLPVLHSPSLCFAGGGGRIVHYKGPLVCSSLTCVPWPRLSLVSVCVIMFRCVLLIIIILYKLPSFVQCQHCFVHCVSCLLFVDTSVD